MGLDTSHGCWHGAYSAFMRWRSMIAKVAGLPPLELMDGFYEEGSLLPRFVFGHDLVGGEARLAGAAFDHGRYRHQEGDFARHPVLGALPIPWDYFAGDPLTKLLRHSDYDGSISRADAGPVADRLAELLPKLPDADGGGHVGNWRAKTQTFIDGLRAAAAADEDVEFN